MKTCTHISITLDCSNDSFRSDFGTVSYETVMDILHESVSKIMFKGLANQILIERYDKVADTLFITIENVSKIPSEPEVERSIVDFDTYNLLVRTASKRLI